MTALLAIFIGSVTGFYLSLVPGLSLALPLSALMALGLTQIIGPIEAACFIGASVGASLYARTLASVYAPMGVTADNVAYMDPAIRLVYRGDSFLAVKLITYGIDLSWLVIGIFGLALTIAALAGVNLAKVIDALLGPLGIPLILAWAFMTCKRSKNPTLTALGLLFSGIYGYAVLNAPVLSGSAHQVAVMLSGLFGIPIAYAAWQSGRPPVPVIYEYEEGILVDPKLAWIGSVLGCTTGFFAGLGAGSLVALAEGLTESDEDYVLMSSAASASNDMMALCLIVAAGMGRSGEAALLGRTIQQPEAGSIVLIIMAILFGIYQGRKHMNTQVDWYRRTVRKVSHKTNLLAIGILTLIPVALAGSVSLSGQISAWGFVLAGSLLALWCRKHYLPNQVAFGSFALPLIVQAAGLTPYMNNLLF